MRPFDAALTATVVISTKDRRDELRRALASVALQTVAAEIIVVDDGSTDGTPEMVAAEFPTAKLVRHGSSAGYIVRRNQAARLATGDVIFSLDDDAEFTAPGTIAAALEDFDDDRIGAVALTFLDADAPRKILQTAPDADMVWLTDVFVGTAHAVRRHLFLELGGYRECLVHQGEERDFCLRMLAEGKFVRLGRTVLQPIRHHSSPRRNPARIEHYGRRNDVLFAYQNVPLPDLCWHLPATIAKGLWFGVRVGRPRSAVRALWQGIRDSYCFCHERRPVSRAVYLLHRRLRREPMRLRAVVAIADRGLASAPPR